MHRILTSRIFANFHWYVRIHAPKDQTANTTEIELYWCCCSHRSWRVGSEEKVLKRNWSEESSLQRLGGSRWWRETPGSERGPEPRFTFPPGSPRRLVISDEVEIQPMTHDIISNVTRYLPSSGKKTHHNNVHGHRNLERDDEIKNTLLQREYHKECSGHLNGLSGLNCLFCQVWP